MITHPFFWTLLLSHSFGWLCGFVVVSLVQLPSWLIDEASK